MNNATFQSLISKRVIFVTGKGGVGKTSLSAILGIAASKAGKKTIIVELDTEGNIPKLFNEDIASEYPIKLIPNLYTFTIQPKKALHEYVILKLRFEALYKILFENRVVKFFINAVPGLNEILMIGKIYHLYTLKGKNKKPLYDLIIVDAPATGHSISFLQVSETVKSIVRLGPIHEDAKKIEALISDKVKTSICLVTLPEETPINEAIEFCKFNEEKLGLNIESIIVNKYIPKLFTEDELYKLQTIKLEKHQLLINDLKGCAEFLYKRHSLNQKNIARFKDETKKSFKLLPFLFTEDLERKHLSELAELFLKETKQWQSPI